MIQFSGASMRFGEKTLFEGLDWLITPRERVGVVGANGSGKTTLLKILSSQEHLESGQLSFQKGLRIGYLPQDGLTLSGRTVFDECLTVFDEAIALEEEQHQLAVKFSEVDPEGAEYSAVADRFQWVTDRYHALDGYTKEAQVGSVLGGLEFPKTDWHRRTEEFSGGWQMRIALAKLLLEKPNLLLLDEPTNHLDLDARNWLEEYLQNYPNAYLVISHDRYFLDTTVKKIIEIWNKKVHFYSGNYTKYEVTKQQQLDQLQAEYKNQQDHIHHLETFITRFRYKASKASAVQSRVKELDKVERIELPKEEKTIHFKFPQPDASGRVVMEFHGVSKSYGSNEVLRDVDFIIERGDRIALVGHNGAGKSTLIRMLAGVDPQTSGTTKAGYKVGIDYFAQDQYKALDPEAKMFEDLSQLLPRAPDSELRGLLGCFLFSGEEVFKPIGVLSGGERNRYAIARMLVRPSNFLLLDEPTNHLDMRAKDVLLRALLDFTGTIVFVSHDRYFIDRLATKVFAVGDGKVEVYPGNYEDFLWQIEKGAMRDAGHEPPAVSEVLMEALSAAKSNGDEPKNGDAQPAAARKRMNPILADKIRGQIGGIEKKISRHEEEIERLQTQLTDAFKVHGQSSELITRMDEVRELIAKFEEEWEELSVKLEEET
jgi:ATP-binding cassette subfamily F protein 3